jgi:crotonobetainyl-CoA:carnitine CoA-transferase CaiB-like acyl-CoA transferase
VRVVGETAASDTVISILSALGAEVERAASVSDDLAGVDVVVVDRIVEGIGPHGGDQPGDADLADAPPVPVRVTISGFGMDGPRSSYRSSELVAAAAGCLLNAVRDESGTVRAVPGSQALRAVGQAATLAVLHGLSLSRERGRAVHLDVSAQEAVAFASVQQELAHLIYNCPGQGGSARYAAPSRLFECRDGLLNIVVIDDHQFARVADVLGHHDWVENYPTVVERNQHADEINQAVAQWARERSKVECEEILQANSVPATAIRTLAEAVASDQFTAREWPYDPETTTRTTGVVPALVDRQGDQTSAEELRTLSDLHVVEVTNVLAGPLAAAIVAAMGATVMRLEDRERLDIYRRNGPFTDGEPGLERAAYFMAANYNKLSVADSLTADPELSSKIMAWGNVLLENVGSGRLTRLGLDGAVLGAGDGGCSVAVSGFGRIGPHSHYRAYAWNVHSYAGLAEAATAHIGAEVSVRSALADYCAAMWAATFGVAWWLGGGSDQVQVDLSMAEVIASKLLPPDDQLVDADRPAGTDLVVILDDERFIAATPDAFDDVVEALGGHRYDDVAEARDEACRLIAEAGNKDADDAVATLQKAGVAAYVVQSPDALLADEQAAARGSFPEVDHPVLGRRKIVGLPWKEAGAPRTAYRAAPLLGSADDEVERIVQR